MRIAIESSSDLTVVDGDNGGDIRLNAAGSEAGIRVVILPLSLPSEGPIEHLLLQEDQQFVFRHDPPILEFPTSTKRLPFCLAPGIGPDGVRGPRGLSEG